MAAVPRRPGWRALADRVAVAGGSIGGLTAGLLLRDLGSDVTIYERSSTELEQRGAGIGFLPAAARYLDERVGLDLDTISVTTDHIRYLARDGSVAHDAAHRYRFSSWNTVYRQLLGAFGRERYRLGHEVTGFDQTDDSVTVRFADGATTEAGLLVCADGVGSPSRAALLPHVRPAYAGYVAWRGMVPEAELAPATAKALGDAITYYVYANSHVLVYPIPGIDGSVAEGERLINFVWYRNYLAGGDLDDLLTDADGVTREISLPPGGVRGEHVTELRATAAARLPAIVSEVIEATERPFLQVIFDLEIERMAFGRVCLVGDAAFVGRPHAAAGTAKAAADAWALAEAVGAHADPRAALAQWEAGQLALGRQLIARTRRIGAHSQFDNDWDPADPELIFGLFEPGR
jgi:2,6-dihydroxypyridine 3-monooxygenase